MRKSKIALRGSTLVGMLLSVGYAGLVCVSANSFSHMNSGLATTPICPNLTAKDRNASEVISQDIQLAHSVESPSTNELVLKGPAGNVAYTYDALDRILIRKSHGNTERLLTGVDFFSFSLLRHGPNTSRGVLLPATPCRARAVACHWSCSRKLARIKLDSEDFQMGAVALRNR
jgi:hypothetical protein